MGKTTSAAAFGLFLAELGAKVLIITVDPAKRLIDTFGNSISYQGAVIANDPVRVFSRDLDSNGESQSDLQGQLWISMLDTKASFDDLVERLCDIKANSQAIIANDVYKNISSRFAYGSEYIAMERVLHLYEQDNWDYIVVDTPPGENLLRLLAAPQRMVQFFSSKMLRLLVAPYRSKVLNIASRPLYEIADRLLGLEMLGKVSEFFRLFEPVHSKFLKRADKVEVMLKSAKTTNFLVLTLDSLRSGEIEGFFTSFLKSGYGIDAVICNLSLPGYLAAEANRDLASYLSNAPERIVTSLASQLSNNYDISGHSHPIIYDDLGIDGLGLLRSKPRSSSLRQVAKTDTSAQLSSSGSQDTKHITREDGKEENEGLQSVDFTTLDIERQKTVLRELLKSIGDNFSNFALIAAEQETVYQKILDSLKYSSTPKASGTRQDVTLIKLPYIPDYIDEYEKLVYLGRSIADYI